MTCAICDKELDLDEEGSMSPYHAQITCFEHRILAGVYGPAKKAKGTEKNKINQSLRLSEWVVMHILLRRNQGKDFRTTV